MKLRKIMLTYVKKSDLNNKKFKNSKNLKKKQKKCHRLSLQVTLTVTFLGFSSIT
jgi:hypothetical protein